jgi:hypothetical protein
MPAASSNSTETELSRVRHAFWLAVIGLFLAVALAVFLVIIGEARMNTSAEVVALVGLFTSVTGTLVGAFFGAQIGAAGAEHERRGRRKAEQIARHALAHLPQSDAKSLLDKLDPVA